MRLPRLPLWRVAALGRVAASTRALGVQRESTHRHATARFDGRGPLLLPWLARAVSNPEVSEEATAAGISCQVALEQPLTCATGLCQGCPVPVLDDDGGTHVVRDCVDGPVFRAGRVDWARLDGGTG